MTKHSPTSHEASTSNPVLEAIVARRSIHYLKPELPEGVTFDDIYHIVQECVKHTPTSFNSQVNRAFIVRAALHYKIWDQVVNKIKEPEYRARPLRIRDGAYGTIFFYVDENVTERNKVEHPEWAPVCEAYADQAMGAASIAAWTVMHNMGIGCNMQHYGKYMHDPNVLPEDIPSHWTMKCQLVFGVPDKDPNEKKFIENIVKVYE